MRKSSAPSFAVSASSIDRSIRHDSASPAMSAPDFAVPIDQRYFEDYVVGSTYEYGTAAVDERETVDFAREFDPQPIHIDPVAAAHGPFGGLIASGWHTAALMMRLFVDNYLSSVASLASPGIDELRWLEPVRPGDTLRIRVTVTEARRSRSKPDRGIVRTLIEVLNQRGETVSTMNALNLLRCRLA
jgi:acyl dehydratase